ncbi:MAG: ATP-binding protein [Candidatus Riflebacteria bacterium]|nr:ATP-binding protein [Candidatus Riflebacteria bacterium]
MRIAVLSGKGGTGKTLVSVNLASVAGSAVYVDCDIEEPNGHLFFKPQNTTEKVISRLIPEIDEDRCDLCRKCVDFCKFNALALIGNKIKLFDKICHSCGGCKILCPQNAITEKEKRIGKVISGVSENVQVETGMIEIGESSGVPIISALLAEITQKGVDTVLMDCPPGSACSVMESIKEADYCVLVAEPTLFGVHNLNMVYELVKIFKKPHGVILNKCVEGIDIAEDYCKEKQLKVISRIPFDKELGKLNSDGEIVSRINGQYKALFVAALKSITEEASHETASDSKR